MYGNLRGALAPHLAGLPDGALEDLVEAELALPAHALEHLSPPLEDFWRDAGRWAARVAPGALAGAAGGAALGPVGAIGGALLGGLTSALGPGSAPQAPPPVAAPAAVPVAAPVVPPAPASVAPARDFAALLGRPEVSQAIAAAALGPNGRGQVSVGGTPVPVAAVLNLLATLLGQAAAAPREDYGEDVPRYLRAAGGGLRCDPACAGERAAVLFELFRAAEADPEAWDEGWDESLDDGWDDGELYESPVDGAW